MGSAISHFRVFLCLSVMLCPQVSSLTSSLCSNISLWKPSLIVVSKITNHHCSYCHLYHMLISPIALSTDFKKIVSLFIVSMRMCIPWMQSFLLGTVLIQCFEHALCLVGTLKLNVELTSGWVCGGPAGYLSVSLFHFVYMCHWNSFSPYFFLLHSSYTIFGKLFVTVLAKTWLSSWVGMLLSSVFCILSILDLRM